MRALSECFGSQWMHRGGGDYFRFKAVSREDELVAEMRVLHAAECILNFRDDPTFSAWLTRASNSVETAVAEIQALCLLGEAGLSATAKAIEQKSGSDYDYIVETSTGRIACEVESRRETSVLSGRSIEKAIREGFDQLPADSDGMVMLGAPYTWGKRPEFQQLFVAKATDAVRQKSSLRSVSTFWPVLVGDQASKPRIGYKIREVLAEGQSRLFASIVEDKVLGDGGNWVALDDVVTHVIIER